ncbi:MAG: hypothetical protein V4492_00660, partial [Chlamydiota bacterium]
PTFKWTGQGTLTLSLPFNFTFKGKSHVEPPSCEKGYCIKQRLYEPVLRNEIVVVDSINRHSTNPEVLNPEHNP